ncbi:hypothetical protein ATANTOWER_022103 [Ataeniobius toweri]|uniref:Uncharacterized protein n=1 Tax=Ataeniobius toweri TaxID=208326 RepID=A0ABU7BQY8_9TELE|nr:hypothetical protein [Ataeniobius toweri]
MLAALAFTLHTIARVVEENKNNIMNEQMNELFFLLPVEEDAFLCHPPISALLQLCVLSSFLEPLFAYLPKFRVMDLVSWSLNAIDQIFLTRRQGEGEPSCPDGTFFSGYTMDSWQKWRIVCLSILSVEDVEDVYTIGCLITGFLFFWSWRLPGISRNSKNVVSCSGHCKAAWHV